MTIQTLRSKISKTMLIRLAKAASNAREFKINPYDKIFVEKILTHMESLGLDYGNAWNALLQGRYPLGDDLQEPIDQAFTLSKDRTNTNHVRDDAATLGRSLIAIRSRSRTVEHMLQKPRLDAREVVRLTGLMEFLGLNNKSFRAYAFIKKGHLPFEPALKDGIKHSLNLVRNKNRYSPAENKAAKSLVMLLRALYKKHYK